MAVFFQNSFDLLFLVKGRVVKDNDAGFEQEWNEFLFQPFVHALGIACFFKRLGRKPLSAPLRHDQVCGFAIVARNFPVKDLAAPGPSVSAIAVFFKAALVEIDDIFSTVASCERVKTA